MRTKDRVPQLLSSDAVMSGIIADRVFYDQSGGGVTFSGGEPMLQIEFLFELLKKCGQNMIHTAVDTCGYAPKQDFIRICELVDLFLYDLKIMDDETHKRYTGVSNELILSNLILLNEKGNKVYLRIPLIPEITDIKENIDGLLEFITPLKKIRNISLLPYNPLGEDKSRRLNVPFRMKHCETQTNDELQSLKRLFETAGYKVKIGG